MELQCGLISLAIFFSHIGASGQKKFTVTLEIPQQLNLQKLCISYDNGKAEVTVKNPVIKNNKVYISELFYSKYAAIVLSCYKTNNSIYRNSFFLTEKPARIILNGTDSLHNPFEKYTLVNAVDFKNEKNKLKNNDSAELREANVLWAKTENDKSLFSDSTFKKELDEKVAAVNQKDWNFICKNGASSYYYFWFFRRNFIKYTVISPDSLLTVFNTIFPRSLTNSEEGNTFKKHQQGRMYAHKNNRAPDFSCNDIHDKKITLRNYQGKEYVLLMFWATWCHPCMEKIPFLQNIWNKYGSKNLKIILVSCDTDYEKFITTVKEKNMNWINIYNNPDVINSYGGQQGIPRVYLIDKEGKIIYYDQEDKDNSTPPLQKLQLLLEQLLH